MFVKSAFATISEQFAIAGHLFCFGEDGYVVCACQQAT
jgi:hypothetical protein